MIAKGGSQGEIWFVKHNCCGAYNFTSLLCPSVGALSRRPDIFIQGRLQVHGSFRPSENHIWFKQKMQMCTTVVKLTENFHRCVFSISSPITVYIHIGSFGQIGFLDGLKLGVHSKDLG